MSLAYESNTDLAFNTSVMRKYGKKYGSLADDLRDMASSLNDCLTELAQTGWTTSAGQQFQKMAENNWEKTIEQYAGLLDTMESIMSEAAEMYEELTENYIETVKI